MVEKRLNNHVESTKTNGKEEISGNVSFLLEWLIHLEKILMQKCFEGEKKVKRTIRETKIKVQSNKKMEIIIGMKFEKS